MIKEYKTMKRVDFLERARKAGIETATVKDDSPRGVKTVPVWAVLVGDYVVIDNHFVLIEG